jgi:DNA-binding transcriptional regulator YiaG
MPSEFVGLVRAALDIVANTTRLAEMCGVSRQTVHLWLAGEREPRPAHREILRAIISGKSA